LKSIPLFPLNAVLFPDGVLPLRIFEPRYLDMISECLKAGSEFGVVLIRQGREAGEVTQVHNIGTLARIVDFQSNEDGLLEIVVTGDRRFRVMNSSVSANRLLRADLTVLGQMDNPEFPVEYELLAKMLREILEKFGLDTAHQHRRFEEPYWVGSRLAEILPIGTGERQRLLEMDDPVQRLDHLQNTIARMELDQ
jgi:hypothetical protein